MPGFSFGAVFARHEIRPHAAIGVELRNAFRALKDRRIFFEIQKNDAAVLELGAGEAVVDEGYFYAGEAEFEGAFSAVGWWVGGYGDADVVFVEVAVLREGSQMGMRLW